MKDIIANLLALQEIQFGSQKLPQPEIDALRKSVPEPILAHYDRLAARGKKGVAIVRNGVCTGCHMRLATGAMGTLMRREDIQLCGTCGRYLYLPEEAAVVAVEEPAPKKAPKRKKKAAAAA
jgi:predicted  nucleic acid-binding Zn-ribbon protein